MLGRKGIMPAFLRTGTRPTVPHADIVQLATARWDAIIEELRAAFRAGDLTLLVGSGASRFSPSSVPTGSEIATRMKGELLNAFPSPDLVRFSYLILNELNESPF